MNWQLFWMSATITQFVLWVGMALVSVHERMPAPAAGEEYGWGIVCSILSMLGWMGIAAYQWGKHSQK